MVRQPIEEDLLVLSMGARTEVYRVFLVAGGPARARLKRPPPLLSYRGPVGPVVGDCQGQPWPSIHPLRVGSNLASLSLLGVCLGGLQVSSVGEVTAAPSSLPPWRAVTPECPGWGLGPCLGRPARSGAEPELPPARRVWWPSVPPRRGRIARGRSVDVEICAGNSPASEQQQQVSIEGGESRRGGEPGDASRQGRRQ